MSTPTMSVLIDEWSEPDENDGEWPYPTEYRRYLITGELADRIRVRFGAADTDRVTITEERISGGYSEFTQETELFFDIDCGAQKVRFDEYRPRVDWGTTTVARLQAWLEEGLHS